MDSMRYELVQLVFAVFSKTGVDGKICLIDFGDSKIIQPDELYDEFVGTIHVTLSIYSHRWWLVVVFDVQYVPPEIVHKTRSGTCLKKGDMWRYASDLSSGFYGYSFRGEPCTVHSVGVIAYILLCGRVPFGGNNQKQIMDNITDTSRIDRFELPKTLTNSCRKWICGLLNDDWDERYCWYTI